MAFGGLRPIGRVALEHVGAMMLNAAAAPRKGKASKPRALGVELLANGITKHGVPFLVNERFQYFRAGTMQVLKLDLAHLLIGAGLAGEGELRNVSVCLLGEALIRGVEGGESDTAVRSLVLPLVDLSKPIKVKVHVAPFPPVVAE